MLNAIDISTLNREELVRLLAEVFARLIGPEPLGTTSSIDLRRARSEELGTN
jgi:hypothetical protein